ncbi:MAG TPA: arginase family protein [Solirubrobacteraceae bacterium]|nr:arginase family protein [Solirubrobacteraceae bacterium]
MDGALSAAVVALLCRTCERDALGAEGARVLAEALAARAGVTARMVGSPGAPHAGDYEQDLRDARGCLLEAGGQLSDALHAGRFPVLTAGTCAICLTTLRALARERPDAFVLWLDAHGDFNSPQTTPSRFLGGMCLAGACGVWEAGLAGPPLDASRVVMCGVRDLDGGERVLLETHGVSVIDRPSRLADALAGREVFVHLDVDVLDPSALPGTAFPVPGGFSASGLARMLAEVAGAASVVGIEITGCPGAAGAQTVAPAAAAVLPADWSS